MRNSPAKNLMRSCGVSLFSLAAALSMTSVALAENSSDLAVANEVVINTGPLYYKVAEKYLKSATGEKDVSIADASNSAILLYIPLDETQPEGAIIDGDEIDQTCRKFQSHVRKLRAQNAEARKNNQTPGLVYNFQCSPNAILTAAALPNDPRLKDLWAVDYGLDFDLDLPQAWDKSTGSNEVVVAIIDTGIDYNHPDLAANMWKNPAELNGVSGQDDDKNGVIDDIYGYNTINNSGDPFDDHMHGTHVAGTIGAVGNNGTGVVGVAWKVKLMAVKFLSAGGSGSLINAVKAIDYVTNQKLAGVNVVASNNSWGGGDFDSALYAAISRANNAGILFVAAAGNNGLNTDSYPAYPAGYDVPNVISVGAIDPSGNYASFSNYGVNSVDVVAPGVGILSSVPGNLYSSLSGTSMATPQVSGAIALLKSYAPTITMAQLRDTLFSTGKPVPSSVGITKYGKMPSAIKMLQEADRLGLGGLPAPPTVAPPLPAPPEAAPPVAPPPPAPTPTIAPGTWSIGGIAKVGGKTIALAKVSLQINGQTLITFTDANGAFKFYNISGPNTYTVSVISAGHTFSSSSGMLSGDVNINPSGIAKSYKLRAKVTDKTGLALAGVLISEPGLGTRLTSADGLAEFSVPYGTNYELSASSNNDDYLDPTLSGQIIGDVTRAFVKLPEL